MGGTRFMVQWEEHPSHLATRLGQLLEHQTLVDVTLMCNTHTLRVHRAVLAACSPYFETILQRQLGMYPLIVLKDMQFSVLKSLIEFMYCGETSVTEDNLSALLQAAKFFQVKGLSAMTKEALGLTSTPKTSTVNGDAARKAFVGRSKRVGMQQTFVASGLKTLTSTAHAAGSHVHGPGGDVHTTTGKTIFQTTPKSVPVRQDTHQQQQQTDTAQLLLSLSGSEFPKQTFHTVSKNVRFHHGVTPSSAVTVEPSRTCPLDSSVVKNKDTVVRSEVLDRVPVVTPSGGVKSSSVMLPQQLAEKGAEQTAVPEKVLEAAKEDVTSQMFFVEDGPCKRGRPLKRQMNLVFQEKVLTDAELALQKEAEASRKALEMLQQEMSTGDETPAAGVTQSSECVQQKIVPVKQSLTKVQTPQPINNILTTAPRILPKEPTASTKLISGKTNVVTQVTSVSTPETNNQNVIYQVAGNTIPAIDSSSNETNIVYQLQEGVISGQDSGNATNIVYQVADNTVVSGQDSNNQNIIFQVAENAATSGDDSNNTNIIYQVADNGTAGSASTMSQYMEALKEAGLPSDVPILLESSDGSYVTVNEEVLMNIMNGAMIQVGDGSIVGGEGVQFIVQEVQEVNEGQVETPVTPVDQTVDTAEMQASTDIIDNGANQTLVPVEEQVQAQETEPNDKIEDSEPAASVLTKPSTPEPEKEEESGSKVDTNDLPLLEEKEPMDVDLAAPHNENVAESAYKESPVQQEETKMITEGSKMAICDSMMETDDSGTMSQIEAPSHSDEIITGDGYGEEAMEGFAVMETKKDTEKTNADYTSSETTDFVFPEQACSNETDAVESMLDDKKKNNNNTEEIPANGGMSVEQALQAMMGEGSDTEMEVCTNTDTDGITKVKPIISHRDTKGRNTPNEGSIDEETEDLRLVLSPEDDSIKVEDESQSVGEGSLNDSFTLALSSPDSSGNEKTHLETENVAELPERVQQNVGSIVQVTGTEAVEEIKTKSHVRIAGKKYTESTSASSYNCAALKTNNDALNMSGDSVNVGASAENSNTLKINESEASAFVKQSSNKKTLALVMDNSVPTKPSSVLDSQPETLTEVLEGVVPEETEDSKIEDISKDKRGVVDESMKLLASQLQPEDETNKVLTSELDGTADERTSELNLMYPIDVENDKVSNNEHGNVILSETDTSNSGFSSNVDTLTPSEGTVSATETSISNSTSNFDSNYNSLKTVVGASTNELGKSLPIISISDSNTIAQGEEAIDKTDSVHTFDVSSIRTTFPGVEAMESAMKTNSDSELHSAENSETGNAESQSSENMKTAETNVKNIIHDSFLQGVLTGNDKGKETQDAEIESEKKVIDPNSVKQLKVVENVESSQGDCVSVTKKNEFNKGREMDNTVHNQEYSELPQNSINNDENGLEASANRGGGAVTSPSKDIPYAVGLLPLKTALEKLQAMPEYHPRKTRSSSAGKESGNEVPASRLKRKASSTADSLEKKLKPSDADDGDGNYESEGTMAMATEDFDVTGDGTLALEGCVADDMKNRLKSPPVEESGEAVPVDKMEPLPSMMELVSDSSDVV